LDCVVLLSEDGLVVYAREHFIGMYDIMGELYAVMV